MSRPARRRVALVAAALVAVVGAAVLVYELRLLSRSSTQQGEVAPAGEPAPSSDPAARAKLPFWPIFRYDERRTGRNLGARARPPFVIKWLRDAPARSYIEVPPVVARGVLVVASYTKHGSHLVAVQARSGRRLWYHHYDRGEIFASTPAIGTDGNVYVTSKDGFLRVFDLRTGRLRWTKHLPGDETESTPVVSRGIVYFGRANGYMYAFNTRTRRLVWRYGPTGGNIASGVALSATTAYFASYGGGIYAVNRFTGRLRWKTEVRGPRNNRAPFYSTPALARGMLLIGSIDHAVYGLNARTGRVRWRFDTGGYVYASAAIHGARLFIGDFDGNFHALSIRTGRRLWTHRMGQILGSASVLGNGVYISSLRPPRTVGLDVRNGRVIWRFRDGQFSPLVADQRRVWLAGRNRFYELRSARPGEAAERRRAGRRNRR